MYRGKAVIQILCFLSLFGASTAHAQSITERTTVGLNKLVWLEKLRISKSGKFDSGISSSSGFGVTFEKSWASGEWGGGFGVMAASGRASAGGFNGSVVFADTGERPFALFGALPRGYYRLTEQVDLGALVPILYRRIDWTSKDKALTVDHRGPLATGATFEIRLRLSPDWEITQAIGALGEGETLWHLGLQFAL